jgi:antitoxin ParD1/3/4
MPGVDKISVALTPELRELVQKAVEAGDYASTSEVVREALRDWKERRDRRLTLVTELRRRWDEGIVSGAPEPLDLDALKREGRRRLGSGGNAGQ